MFVNGVEVISSRLNNISLNSLNSQNNMHPNADKPPACEKTPLPVLHLTPTTANQRRSDGSPQDATDNPWLLKPQHEIPPTPPPKTDQKPVNFFPQRIG
ncbi:uncharacterized protein LOC120626695 [Pararge aegeria]|uniref:Jg20307 protein n=1 Tax=Pararge aegeria aegeria TaxID=348720 RepID=A0A8S4SH29_9NEOP|nr:uncharacterized protein LOC120626695 [Pararge aegeria]CAH2267409.1 jg20307 [Pararge aegeria aegeria]